MRVDDMAGNLCQDSTRVYVEWRHRGPGGVTTQVPSPSPRGNRGGHDRGEQSLPGPSLFA